jgi:hypothetical protein
VTSAIRIQVELWIEGALSAGLGPTVTGSLDHNALFLAQTNAGCGPLPPTQTTLRR